MKTGIMQPYFFPYLGYWQLMNAVDTYVILDDVAYIKRGWINRNFIKLNGAAHRFGIQISRVSQNSRINELSLFDDGCWRENLLKTLRIAYHRAPHYAAVSALFERTLNCGQDRLSEFLGFGIREVAAYLHLDARIVVASEMDKQNPLKGQDRILDLCSRLKTDTYINAIGGRELYERERFHQQGMELCFLKMDEGITYPQGEGDFIPSLSILDVMMYNDPEEIARMLNRYTLV